MRTNKLVIGILAHVDAGKTTLSENILYTSGILKKMGRVDHKDTFLDTNELEKERGITIFAKQAVFPLGNWQVTLLDTPGHVDFSAEMERTLRVLDYAILVINGSDGVQSHTATLWKLLKHYQIPTFLFINKMDQPGTDQAKLMQQLKHGLDERCIYFGEQDREPWLDQLAMCEEALMEEYLETEDLVVDSLIRAIKNRDVFPCYYGSALKNQGVEEFLAGLARYCQTPKYPEEFAARIYKITRDAQGSRLTHMKVTGGVLKVKAMLSNQKAGELWQEKADQLRVYSGSQYTMVKEAEAGSIIAVTGLTQTGCGEGLGAETAADLPILTPVLTYEIQLPAQCDVPIMLGKLRQLEEEEPQLHIVWNEQLGEIHAQVMGEIEIEVLKRLIQERFDVEVEFGSGSILYKETIAAPVEGVGHFEPLRHYAEVHLLLEPGEPDSGLQFDAQLSEDKLDRNWQRLILTHLEEKAHIGVLTGSEITDMKITLVAGRAHLKHTEGGDFRQATYRAVRHGLKKAESILLEPVYEFRLEIPTESVGRAMSDIQKRNGTFDPPETQEDMAVITGEAPVASMRDYQTEVMIYTKGSGRFFCSLKGYRPCHDAEAVIEQMGYDSESDLDNPTGSVFCAHGAGFPVRWDEVEAYMHVESGITLENSQDHTEMNSNRLSASNSPDNGKKNGNYPNSSVNEKELEEIFTRTYGAVKRERSPYQKRVYSAEHTDSASGTYKPIIWEKKEQYLLVDGYNIIFAWDELKELAKASLSGARDKLVDMLGSYQGYRQMTVIVVFDAYKVVEGKGSVEEHGPIYVIYTKEAETADQYIERAVHKLGKHYDVMVATSDNLVQMIIWGEGARRISARGLREEIEAVEAEIRAVCEEKQTKLRNRPFEQLNL